MQEKVDLIIVGAGIVGLAHAYEAHKRGLSVQVIERDWAPNGASIRNFGHACVTAQADDLQDTAFRSRAGWLAAASDTGLWAPETGAIVVARSEAELALVERLREERGTELVTLLTADGVREHLGGDPDHRIVGGAHLPADLRVNPRTAAPELAAWLEQQPRVSIKWGTAVSHVDPGADEAVVYTTRGAYRGDRVLVCVGHDLDYLYPDIAEQYEVTRCALQMALSPAPASFTTHAAVLTGTSMTRYDGFTAREGFDRVRDELAASVPELIEMGANVMFTRLPGGTVLLGDSHVYENTMPPFQEEWITRRLVDEIGTILGSPLDITQRWQGVYASSPQTSLLREDSHARVRCISVTSGIGMTLSFGIAADTLDDLAGAPQHAVAGRA